MRHVLVAIAWATSVLLLVPRDSGALEFFSSTTTHTEVDVTKTAKRMADCSQFKLKKVVGTATDGGRTYMFNGVCKIWVVKFVGGKQEGISGQASLWAYAEAKWNGQTSELEERTKLTDPGGKHTGDLSAKFKCLQDPIVQNASCVRMHFKNGTDWTGFDVPADRDRPMLTGSTTPAEVAALARSLGPVAVKPANASIGSVGPAVTDPGVAKLNAPVRAVGKPAPGPKTSAPAANWSALSAAPAGTLNAATPTESDPTRIAAANVQQELARGSCTAVGGLRFSCATKAGFDQCEALRIRRRVEACLLEQRR